MTPEIMERKRILDARDKKLHSLSINITAYELRNLLFWAFEEEPGDRYDKLIDAKITELFDV